MTRRAKPKAPESARAITVGQLLTPGFGKVPVVILCLTDYRRLLRAAANEQPWATQDGPCPRCRHRERHYWSSPEAVCDGCGGQCKERRAAAGKREAK